MKKILIVEDDVELAAELKIFLESKGHAAQILGQTGGYYSDANDNTGATLREGSEMTPHHMDCCTRVPLRGGCETAELYDTTGEIINSGADIVLLDINLPVRDGQSVLQDVRKSSDIPVIMITSSDSEIDELASLTYGADDYVTKPFNTHILLAKIEAVLRRTGKGSPEDSLRRGEGFVLNTDNMTLTNEMTNEKKELTKNECRILKILLENRGRIVSREELMEYIWESDEFVDDNTLTVNVTRLREKFAALGITDAITTKRGQGYMVG